MRSDRVLGLSVAWNLALTRFAASLPVGGQEAEEEKEGEMEKGAAGTTAPVYAVMANDDVAFVGGSLEQLARRVDDRQNPAQVVFSHLGAPGLGQAFSLFAISLPAVQAAGLFDENFFPAYLEVLDLHLYAYKTVVQAYNCSRVRRV